MVPGLNIYVSNRLEILSEQLAEIVRSPLSSPLDPEVIVVQSRGMARWVSMELAGKNGICANFFFPFPDTILQEMFQKVVPVADEPSLFEPGTMTFRIKDLLPSGFCSIVVGTHATSTELAIVSHGDRVQCRNRTRWRGKISRNGLAPCCPRTRPSFCVNRASARRAQRPMPVDCPSFVPTLF